MLCHIVTKYDMLCAILMDLSIDTLSHKCHPPKKSSISDERAKTARQC